MSNLPSTCPEEETFEGTETWEKRIFNTFFEFERECFKVLQKFSAESSELRFTYLVDQFQEKLFLKCDVFAWFFWRRARRFGLFCEEYFIGIIKKIFSLAQNYVLLVTSVWKVGFKFQTSSKKDSRPMWKTLGSHVKTICLVSTRSYWRTMFFELFINFFLFGLSALTFWMFGELFLVGLLKLAFMGLEDIFERKNFEWNLHNLLVHKRRFFGGTSVWNLRFTSTQPRRWKMRVYCEDLFGRVVKTESFMSRRYYRRKTIFKIFIIFFFFGLSEKSSRTLGRNFFGWKKIPSISDSELMTFRLQLQRKLLAEKYFGGEKVFLHQFPTFSSWCLGLWQKTGRVIKSEFYLSRGNFWQETIFEKKNHHFR